MLDSMVFVKNILPNRNYAEYTSEIRNPFKYWIYNHPTTVKVLEVAIGIFGTLAFGSAMFCNFSLISVSIALLGGAVAIISVLAFKYLGLFIAPCHNMVNHVYTPSSCEGGRLFYQGDIPVLTIDAETPYKAGWAHGYLLADKIKSIRNITFFLLRLNGIPQLCDIKDELAAIRKQIPQKYVEEMEGLVAGYNSKRNEWWFSGEKLTLDELIFANIIPDIHHFNPHSYKEAACDKKTTPQELVACTTVINKDEKFGPTFGRTMDWPSFGEYGTDSLVINRIDKAAGISTVEVGMPGLSGVITGMNSNGLAVAMNVCVGKTNSIRGMPAVFYNRLCLENYKSANEVSAFINTKGPLGPYNLSVADTNEAISFPLYQGESNSHLRRDCTILNPLITTNCNYRKEGMYSHMHYSVERHNILFRYFEDIENTVDANSRDNIELIGASLGLPYVNNAITIHKVLMQPRTGTMKIAFDNSWAGGRNFHNLDTTSLLSQVAT